MSQRQNREPRHFLLVGNGSYENRGCEAIVRGTMTILRKEFGPDIAASVGAYAGAQQLGEERESEPDRGVVSFGLKSGGRRWSPTWWAMQANKRLGTTFAAEHAPLKRHLRDASAALEVGGDNYSLDYGRPDVFLGMDRFLQNHGLPVVLWGASVGPFDADPAFAPRMFEHLRTLAGIFVRESESREYLSKNGVEENVHQVADPAFVMDPVEPPASKLGFVLPVGAIGINLSPLVARYFIKSPRQAWEMTEADLTPWCDFCAKVVTYISAHAQRPVLLVPHVGSALPGNDDFAFLESVRQRVTTKVRQAVLCLPRGLSAAETKWVVAHCVVFAGARTHSTIAALSSGVPTLSVGYSMKARGINLDTFGHVGYCLKVADLSASAFGQRLVEILAKAGPIRELLRNRIPQIKDAAFRAGPLLRQILARRATLRN